MSMDELQIGAGCSVPFGEPWPSNIPRFSSIRNEDRRKPFIIGLGHRAQQGKDTLAAYLIAVLGERPEATFGPYFPIDIRRYAFADELKVEVFDFAQAIALHEKIIPDGFHEPFEHRIYSKEEKVAFINRNKKSSELRGVLQWWGTEFRRAQDPDYWVKKTVTRINEEKPQVAVITDMRFPNETAACDVQINVVRPNFNTGVQLHASETELDHYPYPWTVVGESVEDLKKKGLDLVVGLLKKRGLLPE